MTKFALTTVLAATFAAGCLLPSASNAATETKAKHTMTHSKAKPAAAPLSDTAKLNQQQLDQIKAGK